MYQVLQHQKTGLISVEDLPAPPCLNEGILVKVYYSLISAGTEKTSVTNTQSSLLDRAKKQPDQVRMVMDIVKKEGLIAAYKKVQSKLDSYKSLGYSAAGVVIESACDEFQPGDRVACGGAGLANHAEIISIPKNLAVKLPTNVSFEEASFTTLCSIAMQGVRQADLRLGENVAVIGLGLLGLITIQLLKSSGCRVAGLDVNTSLFDKATSYGCDCVFESKKEHSKSLKAFTDGIGFDSVIITASTNSNDPVEIAMDIARKKGKIVIVGGVGMNLPRSPFYEKELDFTISCSYGPGRYDSNYELAGNDYPAAFVRWTENRNMQSIVSLMASGKLDVKSMISHKFKITDAGKAYDLITGKVDESFTGIILEYPDREKSDSKIRSYNKTQQTQAKIKLGFIGAGSFAQSSLFPYLDAKDVQMIGVSTATPVNAHTAGKKYNFQFSTTDSSEIINNNDINTIFCASRHDSHCKYVLDSLKAGKNIFVEKPLAINYEELLQIDEELSKSSANVMVGFNRRFSESFKTIKEFYSSRTEPLNMMYRINAGRIPADNWVYLPEQGLGRIIGEACHFIDCMVFLTGALPVKVYAESLSTSNIDVYNRDNVSLVIRFDDGSVGTVLYYSNGDPSLPKEYFEAFCEGSAAIMNNFEKVTLYRGNKSSVKNFDGKKGHREEVVATIEAMKTGSPMPIDYNQLRVVTLATFAANESIAEGKPIDIKSF